MSAGVVEMMAAVTCSPHDFWRKQPGDVEIHASSESRLEVRFYDAPDRFRRWMIPLSYVGDLVGWWKAIGGADRRPQRKSSEAQYGCINVAVLSPQQIYIRGRSLLGRPNATGFQLPRPVVDELSTYCASHAPDAITSASLAMSGRNCVTSDRPNDV